MPPRDANFPDPTCATPAALAARLPVVLEFLVTYLLLVLMSGSGS